MTARKTTRTTRTIITTAVVDAAATFAAGNAPKIVRAASNRQPKIENPATAVVTKAVPANRIPADALPAVALLTGGVLPAVAAMMGRGARHPAAVPAAALPRERAMRIKSAAGAHAVLAAVPLRRIR